MNIFKPSLLGKCFFFLAWVMFNVIRSCLRSCSAPAGSQSERVRLWLTPPSQVIPFSAPSTHHLEGDLQAIRTRKCRHENSFFLRAVSLFNHTRHFKLNPSPQCVPLKPHWSIYGVHFLNAILKMPSSLTRSANLLSLVLLQLYHFVSILTDKVHVCLFVSLFYQTPL